MVLIGAITLFISFLKIRITNRFLTRIIAIISPLTLGVYLIHKHNSLQQILWDNIMEVVAMSRDALMPVKVLLVAFAIFTGLLLIDFVRAKVLGLVESTNWYKRMMK